MRLVRPFVQLLRRNPAVPAAGLDSLDAHDPDERVPTDTMHEMLAGAIAFTGDPDLGLKAGRELGVGELGALEYAASSARTGHEAIAVIGRYLHLLNDGLDIAVELEGDRAFIRLRNAVVFPRAAEDFALAAFSGAVRKRLDPNQRPYEVHFRHSGGGDLGEYENSFPEGSVHFDSTFTGFVIERAYLDRELATQDANLHRLISRHAEQLLAELPKVETFTERVRTRLLEELRTGEPSAPRVAKTLGVGLRTMARRLEEEGTSYKSLLDDLRRGLALSYAKTSDLLLADIALLLGFSHAAAFNRAFKRWTGMAPMEYRRAHRR